MFLFPGVSGVRMFSKQGVRMFLFWCKDVPGVRGSGVRI